MKVRYSIALLLYSSVVIACGNIDGKLSGMTNVTTLSEDGTRVRWTIQQAGNRSGDFGPIITYTWELEDEEFAPRLATLVVPEENSDSLDDVSQFMDDVISGQRPFLSYSKPCVLL